MQITDIKTDTVRLYPEFEVHCPNNILPPKRVTTSIPQREEARSSRLPDNIEQCVHVEYRGSEADVADYVRCVNLADGRCGFLCKKHDAYVLNREIRAPQRFSDDEMIAHIFGVERKAMASGKRQKVKLTTKGEFITYLTTSFFQEGSW